MLAGKGLYPVAFVEGTRRQTEPVRLVTMAFRGETDPLLEQSVDAMDWCRVGQLGKIIKFFKKEEVTEIVMVGQITPKNLFEFRPCLLYTSPSPRDRG